MRFSELHGKRSLRDKESPSESSGRIRLGSAEIQGGFYIMKNWEASPQAVKGGKPSFSLTRNSEVAYFSKAQSLYFNTAENMYANQLLSLD